MRHFSSAAAAVIALGALIPFGASGQGSLTITNYQLVSETKITRTVSDFAYRADVVNTTGTAHAALTAVVTSSVGTTQVIQGSLHFTNVPANGQVTSTDTFTIRVDRSVAFDFANLHWTFPQGPIANAGPNQSVLVGATVTLNGSGSSNPSGVGTLTYSWAFSSRPTGSAAALVNPTAVMPTFVADVAGPYGIVLTVSNGVGTDSSSVTVTAGIANTPPVANAGPGQTVPLGSTVHLTGAGSTDADGDPLTYAWTFVAKPTGSTATLTGANTVAPTFVADKPGSYTVQLIVNDGKVNSNPANVVISTQNTPPVANAGPNQALTAIGVTVQLTGAGSTDADGDPLTFRWSLTTIPTGSTAALSSTTIVNPTFVADKAGTYVAQLIVNDGKVDSNPSMVTISSTPPPPTANAGPNQTVHQGTTVHLSGSGTGGTGGPYTFTWSLTTKPAGSTATLTNPTSATPSFVADQAGQYVAQLIINDGSANSGPATVTITTTNTQPVANAGPDQTVQTGATVTLNGSGSSDADNDPLTFAWSFTTKPAGSTATLAGATTVSPTFVPDLQGAYVVQLIVSDPFQASLADTVSITANTAVQGQIILPGTTNVGLGASTAFAVTLPSPAPAGGTTITLSIADGTKVSISTLTLSIAAGATAPATQPQVTGIGLGSTTISASSSSPAFTAASGTVNVSATAAITSTPTTITGTAIQNLTLTLSANAPSGGVTFNVTSSNTGVATVPATVAIAQGSNTVSIPVTGVAPGTTNITATAANVTVTGAVVNVVAPLTAAITPTPATVSLPQTLTLTLTLSQNAPAGGLTFTLNSSNTGVATVPGSVTILANNNAVTFTVTSVAVGTTNITATAPNVTVTGATVNVVAGLAFTTSSLNTGTIGAAYSQTLGTSGGIGTLTFAITAGTLPGGLNFNNATGLISGTPTGTAPSDTQLTFKVTDSSTPTPQTATLGPLNLHINVGAAATITATSGTPQSATVNTAFVAPLVATVKDAGGNPVPNVAVTFTAPGSGASGTFAGGGATNTVNTNASGVATSAAFTANGTAGTYNVTANVSPALGTAATFALTNNGPATITATGGTPQSALPGGAFAPLQATVKDANNNPVSGVTVTFTVNAAVNGAAAAFQGGINTAVTNASGVAVSPALVANGTSGAYTVTANVSPALANAAVFTLSNASIPDSVVATGGTPQAAFVSTAFAVPLVATVKDAGGAPLAGVTVTFNVNPSGSGAGGTFPGNLSTVTAVTDGSGVATSPAFTANATGGSFTVTATAPGVDPTKVATFTFANAPIFQNIAPPTLSNLSIGQNLEAAVTLSLPSPAPTGGAQVFITSLNPSLFLLGGQFAAGTPQVVLTIPEGSTTVVGLFGQSMAASGTVQLSIAANGYGNGTATATLTPSGFILIGPNPNVQSFSTPIGSNPALIVSAARLDSSLNFVEVQQLRGPVSFSATIALSSSDAARGNTVTPASVTINGGDTSIGATFHANAVSPPDAVVTAATPAGYSAPAGGRSQLTITVTNAGITPAAPFPVAQNLEDLTSFTFTPAPAFTTFTITSNDPSKLLFSLAPDAAGQTSISFDTGINAGRTGSPLFYAQALANSGSATYTISASGYSNATGTVNFAPSAFVIAGPFGIGLDFSIPGGANPTNAELQISSRMLDANLTPQAVRGGITVNVPVVSQNTGVGTITTSPVVFTGGVASANTQFHPVANGTSTVSINAPNGFGTAANGSSLKITVTTPNLSCSSGLQIGKGLQTLGQVSLGQAAPSGGAAVTLTSNSPNLKLSASPTTAGLGSIVLNIPAGGISAQYYIQALTDTGSGTYGCTSTGYNPGSGTIFFAPSGVVIYGPFGLNSPFPMTVSLANGPMAFSVSTTILDGGTLSGGSGNFQDLAGGSSLSILLTNSNPSVGTVPSSVTINGGSNTVNPLFTPVSVGNTIISVLKPANFSQPSDNTTLPVKVNP